VISEHQRFQPRSADVASKIMEGEAIIINLANGVYYSLDKVGGLVWEKIVANGSADEIVAAVTARYDVPDPRARHDVTHLLDELLEEGLIAAVDADAPVARESVVSAGERLAYDVPVLNVYRDMGDLLALDPPTPGLDSPWQDPPEARP
jgi:hypothetical protein